MSSSPDNNDIYEEEKPNSDIKSLENKGKAITQNDNKTKALNNENSLNYYFSDRESNLNQRNANIDIYKNKHNKKNNNSIPKTKSENNSILIKKEIPEPHNNDGFRLLNNDTSIPEKKNDSLKEESILYNSEDKLKTNLSKSKNYQQYNLINKEYDFVKNHQKLRVNKDDGDFMKRMLLDTFIRQSKAERLKNMIEKTKVKMDESERIKAFNRLIEDANRRMEAVDNMENMRKNLDNKSSLKKYSTQDWNSIYDQRFMKNYLFSMKNLDDKRKEKFIQELEKEQTELEMCKTKKVSQIVINDTVKRLYDEAERRKISKDMKLKQMKNFDNEKENTPSKYKNGKIENYNFVSENDDELNNKISQKIKKGKMNNTEFNNVRFEKNVNEMNIIENNKEIKKKPQSFSNKKTNNNKKYNSSSTNKVIHNVDTTKVSENFEEIYNNIKKNEDEVREIPKPTENKLNIRVNDMRNIKLQNKGINQIFDVKYMPDIVAEKFVEEIMKRK